MGFFYFGSEVLAAGFGFDFAGRKNELGGGLIDGGVVRFALLFLQIADGHGFCESGLPGDRTFGLELFELAQ